MPEIINWDIIRHPTNWLIIFVILLMWAFMIDLLQAGYTGRHPGTMATQPQQRG